MVSYIRLQILARRDRELVFIGSKREKNIWRKVFIYIDQLEAEFKKFVRQIIK